MTTTKWLNPEKRERKRENDRRSRARLRAARGGAEPKRVIDATGREVLIHENGYVQDAKTGHAIKPGNKAITTSEQGRVLNNIRYENIRAKTRKAILKMTQEAHPEADIKNEDEAYSFGAALTWKKTILNDKAYPRDQIAALEMVGKIADFIPKANQPGIPAQNDGVNIFANISADALLQLAESLHSLKQEGEK